MQEEKKTLFKFKNRITGIMIRDFHSKISKIVLALKDKDSCLISELTEYELNTLRDLTNIDKDTFKEIQKDCFNDYDGNTNAFLKHYLSQQETVLERTIKRKSLKTHF